MEEQDTNGELKSCPISEWHEHLKDVRAWAQNTASIQSLVTQMHRDTQFLNTLPEIAKELRAMRTGLIGPATSRAFLPMGPAMILFSFMTIALIIIGTLKIVEHVHDPASIETTATGLKITTKANHERIDTHPAP